MLQRNAGVMQVRRSVSFGVGQPVEVDLNRPVVRYPRNPILAPKDVNGVWRSPPLQVNTIHNAGVVVIGNETLMLFRSHLRCGKSVLGLARSRDGIAGWSIEPAPVLKPATEIDEFAASVDKDELIEDEAGGVEDARITKMGDTYAITYSAYHGSIMDRVRVSLATTQDFKRFIRHGPLVGEDMRNVVLFPEKINGKYVALFRFNEATEEHVGGAFTEIRIAYAEDWRSNKWQIAEKPIMRTGGGPSAFSHKIGPGAPPIKTTKGWLSIFHGVRKTMDGNPYVLGVALHVLDDPARVKVSSIPILFPSKADCRVSDEDYVHVPNVVFTCGALRREDGAVLIYYGGNDTVMNVGITHEDVLVALCEHSGQDPMTGELLYDM
jgi:predicted GH43/DUF377 family glycosyl hydrolase